MADLSRRGFIGGLIGIVAAPAIVRASALMPVKVIAPEPVLWLEKAKILAMYPPEQPLYLVLPQWMLVQYRGEAEAVARSYGATVIPQQVIPT